MAITEHTALIRQAVAYVIELHRELTGENGAPTLGTQNQVVDFILADPALCRSVSAWAQTTETEEATTEPAACLPRDSAYQRIRAYLQSIMEQPAFMRPGREPSDRR